MAEINLLAKEVYNRIAAGEVVENPASIVKELAENSVDAGANYIEIEIEDGGIRSVSVSDNGSGIPRSEVKKAFFPHATSKIKSAEDMETVGTLGFRGEALPSIASVSKMRIRTKFISEESATEYLLRGGEEESFAPCALEKGTIVEVNALFFNTPARFKFLKSARSEEAAVTNVVQNLILSNPNVAFRYVADGELKLASDGGGFASAVKSVYTNIFNDLIPLKIAEDAYRIVGFISKPSRSKGNRSAQTLILNGRVVAESAVSASVQNAYGERLMTRNFPIFILDVVMPFELVDVNVHPSKAEVRLREPRRLYGLVYRAVKETLEKFDRETEASFLNFGEVSAPKTDVENPSVPLFSDKKTTENRLINAENPEKFETTESLSAHSSSKESLHFTAQKPSKASGFDEVYAAILGKSDANLTLRNPIPVREYIKTNRKDTELSENQIGIFNDTLEETPEKRTEKRVVGQIFQCYLLVECGDRGYIIDQHAAHERTIYDILLKNAEKETPESQTLLVPYLFEGTYEECSFILKNAEELKKMGFELSEFGKNVVKVDAVPSVITGLDFQSFFRDLLSDMSGIRNLKTTEFLRGKLASTACKSAIKAGDALTPKQIDYFIDVYCASGAPILCPHGRPTIVPFDKNDLEKRFKRKL